MERPKPWVQRTIISDRLKHAVCGATAGCVAAVVTCPLDVVKTRLQYQRLLDPRIIPYKGTWGTLCRIWSEEGLRGLYRGLGPTVIGYLPTWAIYFTTYENGKQWLREHPIHVTAAMTAGGVSSCITNPIWVVKTRFMIQNNTTLYRYAHTLDAFRTILTQEGWKGLYRGLGSSLLGVTHVAVQFPLYERLRVVFKPMEQEYPGVAHILGASAMAKMTASCVTYPHEVIRTRLQTQSTNPPQYHGILDAIRVIYREEGWKAFYKGLSTNLIRTVPSSVLLILTYELLTQNWNYASTSPPLEGSRGRGKQ
ncbi:MAG: mitochondrial carrier domain-containing protein [Piptocephalis tieghemiana]|nr:MAG: mitochondrial carrier domain-containing protein [Piptocephalis tieghemiana]